MMMLGVKLHREKGGRASKWEGQSRGYPFFQIIFKDLTDCLTAHMSIKTFAKHTQVWYFGYCRSHAHLNLNWVWIPSVSHPTGDRAHTHTHTGLIKRLLHPEEVCVGSFRRGQSLHLNTTLNSGAPLPASPSHCWTILPSRFTFSSVLPLFFSPSLLVVQSSLQWWKSRYRLSHSTHHLQMSHLGRFLRILVIPCNRLVPFSCFQYMFIYIYIYSIVYITTLLKSIL